MVKVDGETLIDEPYSSQPAPDVFEYVYGLEEQEGSTITVTAHCNQVGSTSASIEGGQDVETEKDTTGFTTVSSFRGITISLLSTTKKDILDILRYPGRQKKIEKGLYGATSTD